MDVEGLLVPEYYELHITLAQKMYPGIITFL